MGLMSVGWEGSMVEDCERWNDFEVAAEQLASDQVERPRDARFARVEGG